MSILNIPRNASYVGMMPCDYCGKMFLSFTIGGRQKRFDSPDCKTRYWLERTPQGRAYIQSPHWKEIHSKAQRKYLSDPKVYAEALRKSAENRRIKRKTDSNYGR